MLTQLSDFCSLANQEIERFYGRKDSCIFSTAAICDVLTHFGLEVAPLRVEAAVFPDDRKVHGCVLGSFGDGAPRRAAGADMWHGHLVSFVEECYLLDTTLDQAKVPGVGSLVIDLCTTKWFDQCPTYRDMPWTGLLRPWPGIQVRYTKFHRQNGWQHAGDFRPRRRQEIVQTLIEKATPLFKSL